MNEPKTGNQTRPIEKSTFGESEKKFWQIHKTPEDNKFLTTKAQKISSIKVQ